MVHKKYFLGFCVWIQIGIELMEQEAAWDSFPLCTLIILSMVEAENN